MEYQGWKVGQEIRKLRNKKKMTIEELSFKLGMSTSHINQLELGSRKMSIDLLYKIMSELDTDANTVLAVPDRLHRITSYNVCYTKLLRSSITFFFLLILHLPLINSILMETSESFDEIVITSYSIHYTKLYDRNNPYIHYVLSFLVPFSSP